jgi:hypothetical protein
MHVVLVHEVLGLEWRSIVVFIIIIILVKISNKQCIFFKSMVSKV